MICRSNIIIQKSSMNYDSNFSTTWRDTPVCTKSSTALETVLDAFLIAASTWWLQFNLESRITPMYFILLCDFTIADPNIFGIVSGFITLFLVNRIDWLIWRIYSYSLIYTPPFNVIYSCLHSNKISILSPYPCPNSFSTLSFIIKESTNILHTNGKA